MVYLELLGGLGNQMFIYAFARFLVEDKKIPVTLWHCAHPNRLAPFCINTENLQIARFEIGTYEKLSPWRHFIFRQVKRCSTLLQHKKNWQYVFLKGIQPIINFLGVSVSTEQCLNIQFYAWNKTVLCDGYFQGERYLSSIAEKIRVEFTLKNTVDDCLQNEIASSVCPVCVHIRRGDYTTQKFKEIFLVCTPFYYKKALYEMQQKYSNAHFFVFSDNIAWVKENIAFPQNTKFVEDAKVSSYTAQETLQMMSKCQHFILSNSSFSWWAQFMQSYAQKTVIAPSKWYHKGWKSDLYQSNWMRIDVESESELFYA